MGSMVFWLPVFAFGMLWGFQIYLAFGRARQRWFYRRFPGRRAEESARIVGLGLAWALMAVQLVTVGPTGAPWFVFAMCSMSAVTGLLGWRAARAGEPEWGRWKSSLPARPD